jgi:hypothetical protein
MSKSNENEMLHIFVLPRRPYKERSTQQKQ